MILEFATWITVTQGSLTVAQIDGNIWRATSLPVRSAVLYTNEGVNSKLVASCVFADDVRLVPQAVLSIVYRGRLREFSTGVDVVV
jgi:hypothetical protein